MGNNTVKEFLNEMFGQVRVTEINNELWFVANDVAKSLEYELTTDMTRKLDNDETAMQTLHVRSDNGICQNRNMLVINESGLYNSVLSITKRNTERYEKAKKFKKWITKNVIPALRKDGAYIDGEEKVNKEMSEDEFILKAMSILNNKVERLRKENSELKEENGSMKTVVSVADKFLNTKDSYDIGTLSKILEIPKFGRNKLFAWLKENKILMSNNIPYQVFAKYFNIITTEKNGHTFTKTMVKATGIKYIYKKLTEDNKIINKPIEQILEELNTFA